MKNNQNIDPAKLKTMIIRLLNLRQPLQKDDD